MKKVMAFTSIIIACTTTAPVTHGATTEVKQGAVLSTSAIAGAIIGGPVGFFLGALGGVYMSEQIEKADNANDMEKKLADVEFHRAELQTRLDNANNQTSNLKQIAQQKLNFQVLFHTGADQLTVRGKDRVQALAALLRKHPYLNVRLSGHADPRGTDEYNNVLSDQRALAVQNTLQALGVELKRIERQAFGASQSNSAQGDIEGYAMDRRVNIEIVNPADNEVLAQRN